MQNEWEPPFRAWANPCRISAIKQAEQANVTMLMIAEDNASMRRMIRGLVEDIVSEIIECADGSEAIETYERHRPEWVLMDIGMQPTDGLTATREIVSRHPDARVVIVTQHQDTATRETALALGACAFVGKDDLLALRKLVSGESLTSGEDGNG